MTDGSTSYDQPDVPTPAADLKALGERLVGAWRVTGGAEGTVRFEWMQGGFFLIQHVELEQYGQRIGGIEVVGHLRSFGQPPSQAVHSRFYDSTGNTLNYVYELGTATPSRSGPGRRAPPPTTGGPSAPTATAKRAPGSIPEAAATRRPPPGSRVDPQRHATTVLVAAAETDRFASALYE
jgi:hypothetical protein